MQLPQRLVVEFIPVDEGNLAEIEIIPHYKCDRLEVLELLKFATERLEEMVNASET